MRMVRLERINGEWFVDGCNTGYGTGLVSYKEPPPPDKRKEPPPNKRSEQDAK